jgi:glycosyltransferase involved in cell wall biosynthesis
MKISVLVPSFNSAPFLQDALDSALAALRPDDEIIVQDGGSTDATISILQRASSDDPRVHFLSEPDSGQSNALNRALDRASGELVLWLNADDVVYADALQLARERFEETEGLELVIAGHKVLVADGSPLGEYPARRLDRDRVMSHGCYVFSGSILLRRQLLQNIGRFREDLHFCMDLDLMLRLSDVPQSKVAIVQLPLGALRRHDASKSGTVAFAFVRDGWRVRGEYARNWRDQVRRVRVAIQQPIVSAAKPIRFSRTYRRIRGRL